MPGFRYLSQEAQDRAARFNLLVTGALAALSEAAKGASVVPPVPAALLGRRPAPAIAAQPPTPTPQPAPAPQPSPLQPSSPPASSPLVTPPLAPPPLLEHGGVVTGPSVDIPDELNPTAAVVPVHQLVELAIPQLHRREPAETAPSPPATEQPLAEQMPSPPPAVQPVLRTRTSNNLSEVLQYTADVLREGVEPPVAFTTWLQNTNARPDESLAGVIAQAYRNYPSLAPVIYRAAQELVREVPDAVPDDLRRILLSGR